MKVLNKTLVVSLLLVFCFILAQDAASEIKELESQKKLRQEIQLLNLLIGLYLTDGQMSFLIEKAQQAEEIQETFKGRYKEYSQGSTETLEKLKKEIKEDKQEVSEEIARTVHRQHRKLLECKTEYDREMEQVISEAKNSLTSKQLAIIEEFEPCLVPPKGPARFGQANDSPMGIKQLERIRQIPPYRYSVGKDDFAKRMAERALIYKRRGEEIDEEKLKAEILAIMDRARALSEIDFNLRKEGLAQGLKQIIVPEIKTLDIDTKIEHFLLNPAIISLLEDKLAALSPD